MRNGNFLKMRVSEIRVKRICVNQGLGVEVNFESFSKCDSIDHLVGQPPPSDV